MARQLTSGEAALAREALGHDFDATPVRILAAPWPVRRAFVIGRWFGRDWIIWPRRSLPPDFATASLAQQGVLVHEMVHVWQARQGVSLLVGKLKAGDGPGAYAYPLGPDCEWRGLNIEQQAMVVEHRFLLSRGGRAPAGRDFYARVCPLGARMEI